MGAQYRLVRLDRCCVIALTLRLQVAQVWHPGAVGAQPREVVELLLRQLVVSFANMLRRKGEQTRNGVAQLGRLGIAGGQLALELLDPGELLCRYGSQRLYRQEPIAKRSIQTI